MFTFQKPRNQIFSFPSNIIYYICCNPSFPKAIVSLYKTCKYFYSINQILVCEDGRFGDFQWPGPMLIQKKRFQTVTNFPAKFWFTRELHILDFDYLEVCSIVTSHIYRCNLTELQIWCQKLSNEEFDLLIKDSTITKIDLTSNIITDKNGQNLTFDIIFQKLLPNIEKFLYEPNNEEKMEMITDETLKNLNNFNYDNAKLDWVRLDDIDIPLNIDLGLMFSFFEKSASLNTSYTFRLNYENDNHLNQIKKAVKKMLSKWTVTKKKPSITFEIYTGN